MLKNLLVSLRDFPCDCSLFELVSYSNPCIGIIQNLRLELGTSFFFARLRRRVQKNKAPLQFTTKGVEF